MSRMNSEFVGKFRLHRKLLFGRDGVGRQTIQRVRFAKRCLFVRAGSVFATGGMTRASGVSISTLDGLLANAGNSFQRPKCHPWFLSPCKIVWLVSGVSLFVVVNCSDHFNPLRLVR